MFNPPNSYSDKRNRILIVLSFFRLRPRSVFLIFHKMTEANSSLTSKCRSTGAGFAATRKVGMHTCWCFSKFLARFQDFAKFAVRLSRFPNVSLLAATDVFRNELSVFVFFTSFSFYIHRVEVVFLGDFFP